jgi:hypothetical protein
MITEITVKHLAVKILNTNRWLAGRSQSLLTGTIKSRNYSSARS